MEKRPCEKCKKKSDFYTFHKRIICPKCLEEWYTKIDSEWEEFIGKPKKTPPR